MPTSMSATLVMAMSSRRRRLLEMQVQQCSGHWSGPAMRMPASSPAPAALVSSFAPSECSLLVLATDGVSDVLPSTTLPQWWV